MCMEELCTSYWPRALQLGCPVALPNVRCTLSRVWPYFRASRRLISRLSSNRAPQGASPGTPHHLLCHIHFLLMPRVRVIVLAQPTRRGVGRPPRFPFLASHLASIDCRKSFWGSCLRRRHRPFLGLLRALGPPLAIQPSSGRRLRQEGESLPKPEGQRPPDSVIARRWMRRLRSF